MKLNRARERAATPLPVRGAGSKAVATTLQELLRVSTLNTLRLRTDYMCTSQLSLLAQTSIATGRVGLRPDIILILILHGESL